MVIPGTDKCPVANTCKSNAMAPSCYQGPGPIGSGKYSSQWETRSDPDHNSLVSAIELSRDLKYHQLCQLTDQDLSQDLRLCFRDVQHFVCLFVCFLLGGNLQRLSGCQGVSDAQKQPVAKWDSTASPVKHLASGTLERPPPQGSEGPQRMLGPWLCGKGLSRLAGDPREMTSEDEALS